VLYNSVTVNVPKNTAQFLLGAVLFITAYGAINLWALVVALIGFIVAYSSVYIYNDITDAAEDRKDPSKMPWKPVANGSLSVRSAKNIHATLLIVGLAITALSGWVLFSLVAVLLVLNFLHSSPAVRLKARKKATVLNIGAMALIKFSCGWFAVAPNANGMPALFILMMAVVYALGYVAYKSGTLNGGKCGKMDIVLGGAVAVLFAVSLFSYNFPLSMLLLLLFYGIIYGLGKLFSGNSFRSMLAVDIVIIPVLTVPFMLLLEPVFAAANNGLIVFLASIF
jgi:hypothetical protein